MTYYLEMTDIPYSDPISIHEKEQDSIGDDPVFYPRIERLNGKEIEWLTRKVSKVRLIGSKYAVYEIREEPYNPKEMYSKKYVNATKVHKLSRHCYLFGQGVLGISAVTASGSITASVLLQNGLGYEFAKSLAITSIGIFVVAIIGMAYVSILSDPAITHLQKVHLRAEKYGHMVLQRH